MHEYIHILYNECVRQENEHFTWMDEGIAMNLSKEKGRFVKEKISCFETRYKFNKFERFKS